MDVGNKASQKANHIEGRYANCFKIGFNAFEFVLDFIQLYPDNPEEKFSTRIITNPAYAKALLKTLSETIEKYENTFGRIEEGY